MKKYGLKISKVKDERAYVFGGGNVPVEVLLLFSRTWYGWICKSFFNTPSLRKTTTKIAHLKTQLFFPRINGKSFSSKCQKSIGSSVSSLFLPSSPLTILLTIVPIYTNSVNCCILFSKLLHMFYIGRVHIISKLFKRLPKTLDAFPSVVSIFRIIRVIAPSPKCKINTIETQGFWPRRSKTMRPVYSKSALFRSYQHELSISYVAK